MHTYLAKTKVLNLKTIMYLDDKVLSRIIVPCGVQSNHTNLLDLAISSSKQIADRKRMHRDEEEKRKHYFFCKTKKTA